MKTEILPFRQEMITDAAALLAARHQRDRQTLSFLPPRFAELAEAETAVQSVLAKALSGGYAAARGGQIVAYLIGNWTVEPWGRCGWIWLPGSALSPGESAATLQDLYVRLGDDWVSSGVFYHRTYQGTADRKVIEAWFDLGFGKERIDAVSDFRQYDIPDIQIPDGVKIRRAGAGDEGILRELSPVIMRELAKAPYWHPTPPERWPELAEGYAELATDPEVRVWMATENGAALGIIGFWDERESAENMLVGPGYFTFSVAATRESARGRGIGSALCWTGLRHYRDEGYIYCYNNWISPNLSASRLWPRFGFQEAAYRLARNLNPMIAWTR
ncbi:MAG: GNAT family N-acetyltransferase [Anaerolineae bacterium]|nr:GNAT family N-acetyltransferase [Anaerolineae bacterium]